MTTATDTVYRPKTCTYCKMYRHKPVVLFQTDDDGRFRQYNKHHRYFWDTPNRTFIATCGECGNETSVTW